jgi:16S rRNA G527 N7-methylase RsmG
MTKEELLQLKSDIDDYKSRLQQWKGQKSALLQQLKEDWGLPNVKSAEARMEKLKSKQQVLARKIAEKTEELENQIQ